MKQKKSYPYKQYTAPESSEFNKLCKELKEFDLRKEYLLELYNDARSSVRKNTGEMTPFKPTPIYGVISEEELEVAHITIPAR